MTAHRRHRSGPGGRPHGRPRPRPFEPQSAGAPPVRAVPNLPASDRIAAVEGIFESLIPELRAAIGEAGYRTPTPIQQQAIPVLLRQRDILGCAQTGTGKTAAFALPLLQKLHADNRQATPRLPLALILAPTRELAIQIGESMRLYSKYLRIGQTTIYGGVNQNPQVRELQRGVHIVIATPGRLMDLVRQRAVDLRAVETFVLDEADRMLDMGFIPDIRRIAGMLPTKRQSLLFSATLSEPIRLLAAELVRNPEHIAIAPDQPTVEKIEQKVFFVDKQDKLALLTGMLRDEASSKVLVFTQMKHAANRISNRLSGAGIAATAIHGNKSQGARTRALADFKSGAARVLVATDIAARGIDVAGISHVINFDVPLEAETYVHRIGRTARAGADGTAVSFCCAEERGLLRAIERLLRQSVPVDQNHAFHSSSASRADGGEARGTTPNRRPPPSRRRRAR